MRTGINSSQTFASITFPPAPNPRRALTLLFARYIAGQIAEQQWQAFASAYDAVEVDGESRAALAAFCNDALAEMGGDARMPSPQDVLDFLSVVRGVA